MNETFRRYLLRHRAAVEAAIPKGAGGAWESIQRPITVGGVALAGLLFVTQQDLFNAATGTVLAMSTGLASVAQVVGLFGGRRAGGGGGR